MRTCTHARKRARTRTHTQTGAKRCSNNQDEQLAIAKALEKIQDLNHLQGNQWSVAIHTDSRITLDAMANPRNHQNLVEQIRDEIRRLENDNWTIHFTWVKTHNNFGNELADQLAKEAASSSEAETAYNKIPKSAMVKELKEESELVWQSEWDASTKGEITKSFFPIIRDQISKRLQMGINLSTIVTGHGTLRSYYRRFKIIDDPTSICKMGPQTADHLLWEFELLRKQREVLKNCITKAGRQ